MIAAQDAASRAARKRKTITGFRSQEFGPNGAFVALAENPSGGFLVRLSVKCPLPVKEIAKTEIKGKGKNRRVDTVFAISDQALKELIALHKHIITPKTFTLKYTVTWKRPWWQFWIFAPTKGGTWTSVKPSETKP